MDSLTSFVHKHFSHTVGIVEGAVSEYYIVLIMVFGYLAVSALRSFAGAVWSASHKCAGFLYRRWMDESKVVVQVAPRTRVPHIHDYDCTFQPGGNLVWELKDEDGNTVAVLGSDRLTQIMATLGHTLPEPKLSRKGYEFPEMAVPGAPRPRHTNLDEAKKVATFWCGGQLVGRGGIIRRVEEDGDKYYLVTATHVLESADGISGPSSATREPFLSRGARSVGDVSLIEVPSNFMSRHHLRSSGAVASVSRRVGSICSIADGVKTIDVQFEDIVVAHSDATWPVGLTHTSVTTSGDSGSIITQGGRAVAVHVGYKDQRNIAVPLVVVVDTLFGRPSPLVGEVVESIVAENRYFSYVDPHDFVQSHRKKDRRFLTRFGCGAVDTRGHYTVFEPKDGNRFWADYESDEEFPVEYPEKSDFRKGPAVSPKESQPSMFERSSDPQMAAIMACLSSLQSQFDLLRVRQESPELKSPMTSSSSQNSEGMNTRRRSRGKQQGLSLKQLVGQQQNVRQEQGKAEGKST